MLYSHSWTKTQITINEKENWGDLRLHSINRFHIKER